MSALSGATAIADEHPRSCERTASSVQSDASIAVVRCKAVRVSRARHAPIVDVEDAAALAVAAAVAWARQPLAARAAVSREALALARRAVAAACAPPAVGLVGDKARGCSCGLEGASDVA